MNPDGVKHMITKRKAPRQNIQEDEVSKRARLGAFDHHADGMESFVHDFSVKSRDFRSADSTDAPLLQSTSASVKGTFLRRLHDEDGVTVDLVLRNESLVVYKTYPTQDDMPCLIQLQDEVRLFHRMKGACHTIQLLETFCNEDGDFVLVFPYIEDVRPKGAQEIQVPDLFLKLDLVADVSVLALAFACAQVGGLTSQSLKANQMDLPPKQDFPQHVEGASLFP